MNTRRLLVLGLLALSFSAAADFTTITAAYEVAVSDLRLPMVETGTVSFRQCDGCEVRTIRVTAATRYVLNDRDVGLAKFREAAANVRKKNDATTTVMHHLESNTVTKIMLYL